MSSRTLFRRLFSESGYDSLKFLGSEDVIFIVHQVNRQIYRRGNGQLDFKTRPT